MYQYFLRHRWGNRQLQLSNKKQMNGHLLNSFFFLWIHRYVKQSWMEFNLGKMVMNMFWNFESISLTWDHLMLVNWNAEPLLTWEVDQMLGNFIWKFQWESDFHIIAIPISICNGNSSNPVLSSFYFVDKKESPLPTKLRTLE